MKKALSWCILLILVLTPACRAFAQTSPAPIPGPATLTLIGHASVKIKTSAGTVLYIDPSAKGDYSEKADLILVSHEHSDHNKVSLCAQGEGCLTLRAKQTINKDGSYNTFSHLDILVEPFPAYNKNHQRTQTNGFLITFDGITVYFASDTDKIPEMTGLADRSIDYALFPIDGKYNMDSAEAMACAAAVKARHNTPIHWLNADPAGFKAENLLFIPYGEAAALAGN